MQERFKSKVLWLAIASAVAMLMSNYGLWSYIGMTNEFFNQFVEAVLLVMTLLGIINNPTDGENW